MAETTDLSPVMMAAGPDVRLNVPGEDRDWREVQQSLAGDDAACARLFGRYTEDVGRQMRRFSRNAGVCEELVHEVFVEVYLSLRHYRHRGVPFGHWLARIATRVGYRHWKQQSRRRVNVPLDGVEVAAREGDNSEAASAAALLQSLLARLAAADRLVLTLMYFEDCSVLEIAERTGWNRAMVKMRVYRARRRLKEIIEKHKLLEQFQGMIYGNT